MKFRTLVMIIIVASSAAGCRGSSAERSESAVSSPSGAPRTPSTEYPPPGEGKAGSGDQAAVRRAVEEIYEAERRCFADYPNCDESAFETVLTGDALAYVADRSVTHQAANKTTTGAETWKFEFESIIAQEDSALVMGCTSNHVILYNADGSVDDGSFWSAKGMWQMVLVDGKWLGENFLVLESATGVDNDLCGGREGLA